MSTALGLVKQRRRLPVTVAVSIVVLALVALAAVLHSFVMSWAMRQDVALGPVGAGVNGHLAGTDQLGRDVLALTIGGAGSAVVGPLVIAAGSMLIGLFVGGIAGFRGGAVDMVAARYADLLLALPAVLLAIVVAGVLGGGYWITVAVLIVLFSPSDVRLVRAAVMEQMPRPYIESARVLGVRPRRILVRHVAPNIVPVVVANALLNVAFALVALSSLSYLGLGAPPGAADWGRQLNDGREILVQNPMACILPGILIIVTATAANLVGDWLSDVLEAKVAVR